MAVINVVDRNGNPARVDEAHLKRYPSLAAEFRRVPVETAATVARKTPTGGKKKES